MRILHLSDSISKQNGRMSVIMNAYSELSKKGYTFDFLVTSSKKGAPTYEKEIHSYGGKIFTLNRNDLSYSRMKQTFLDIIETENYDYIHYHAISPWGVILPFARKKGIKVITHSHATKFGDSFLKSLRNKLFSKILLKYSDKNIAVSTEAGESFFHKNIFSVIPNYININQFRYNAESRNLIRKRLGIDDNNYLIGNVARFSKQKNHIFLIKTFKKIHEKDSSFRLLLIGSGPEEKRINKMISKFGMEKYIYMVGEQKNVNDWYSAMDLFWLPSKFEGLPTVALEAQANGLRCFLSDTISTETAVINTFFLNIMDSKEWVDRTLIDNNSRLMDINYIKESFLSSRYNFENIIELWENLYNN